MQWIIVLWMGLFFFKCIFKFISEFISYICVLLVILLRIGFNCSHIHQQNLWNMFTLHVIFLKDMILPWNVWFKLMGEDSDPQIWWVSIKTEIMPKLEKIIETV